ncbi:MAG: PfkB family carbohydrate kinase [Fidelibacterota bacterium]
MVSHPVLVVGSIAIDWLEFSDGRQDQVVGGSATYFTLAASLFAPVHVVGVVGSDFPEEAMDVFRKHGANLDDLQVVQGKTFRWGGRYGADLESRTTLFTELGVFEDFQPLLSPENRRCPVIFLGNIQPSLQLKVLDQAEHPKKQVVCDTMNLWIKTARNDLLRVLERVDVLLLSEREAVLLTDVTDPAHAGDRIRDMGPSTVVVKRGHLGSVMVTESGAIRAGVFPVPDVVDPTGAGDSFAGGFVGTLAGGSSLAEALLCGSAVASYCVEGFGTAGLETLSRSHVSHRMDVIRERSKLP